MVFNTLYNSSLRAFNMQIRPAGWIIFRRRAFDARAKRESYMRGGKLLSLARFTARPRVVSSDHHENSCGVRLRARLRGGSRSIGTDEEEEEDAEEEKNGSTMARAKSVRGCSSLRHERNRAYFEPRPFPSLTHTYAEVTTVKRRFYFCAIVIDGDLVRFSPRFDHERERRWKKSATLLCARSSSNIQYYKLSVLWIYMDTRMCVCV